MRLIKNMMLILLFGIEINFASRYVFGSGTQRAVAMVLMVVIAVAITFVDYAWELGEETRREKESLKEKQE